jgi:hypothetical protein
MIALLRHRVGRFFREGKRAMLDGVLQAGCVAALGFYLCPTLQAMMALTLMWRKGSLRFHQNGWDGFGSTSTSNAGSDLNKSNGCTDISPAR